MEDLLISCLYANISFAGLFSSVELSVFLSSLAINQLKINQLFYANSIVFYCLISTILSLVFHGLTICTLIWNWKKNNKPQTAIKKPLSYDLLKSGKNVWRVVSYLRVLSFILNYLIRKLLVCIRAVQYLIMIIMKG